MTIFVIDEISKLPDIIAFQQRQPKGIRIRRRRRKSKTGRKKRQIAKIENTADGRNQGRENRQEYSSASQR